MTYSRIRIIRINYVIRIIRNTRIKQLRSQPTIDVISTTDYKS